MKIIIDFHEHYRNHETRTFPTKKEAKKWIMSGIRACDGAEQMHYTSMLCQLEDGETTLVY